MSEKYYLVSESELDRLRDAAWSLGFSVGAAIGDLDEAQADKVEAEAACRAREVESIGCGMYLLTNWDFTEGEE